MAGLTSPFGLATENRRTVSRIDWPLLFTAALLLAIGAMSLYSVGASSQLTYFRKQLLYVAIGIVPFSLFVWTSPYFWRRSVNWLYCLNLLMLIAVLVFGHHAKGAERWISLPGGMQFQPSELAKLLTVLTVSTYYANRHEDIQRLSTFLVGFLHVSIPMLLIWKQPHLGAALVVLVMWVAVSIVAGVPTKYLAWFVVTLVLVAGVGLSVPSLRAKLMSGYQDKRVEGMVGTTKDLRGKNWQTDRAEIAFGVGGLTGTGFLRGEQKQAGFIPEQHTDFIVTVIGEEGGLVGCALLLGAYGFFFYRVFLVMLNATDPYFKMIAAGIFAILGFHTFVNIAMVLQLVPVVGLWLPFMSYGGTAIWLCMASVGLLLGIRRRQRPLLF